MLFDMDEQTALEQGYTHYAKFWGLRCYAKQTAPPVGSRDRPTAEPVEDGDLELVTVSALTTELLLAALWLDSKLFSQDRFTVGIGPALGESDG